MTVESILTSIESERRWVDNFMRSFQSDLTIGISPCVFQVPKSFAQTKPHAYTPQKIGLGPYHHLRPEFFTTQMHKLTIAKNFLNNDHQIQHFAEEVLDKLWSVEPLIRAYYAKYLDLEGKTLVWILATDSLYLLNFLNSYNIQDDQEVDDSNSHERRKLAQDIVMLENQIPSFVLIETRKALFQPYNMLFSEQFYNFCKAHSPLKLTDQTEFHSLNSPHLLAYMHHLIVNNHGNLQEEEEGGGLMPMSFQYIVPIVKTAVNLGLPGSQMIAKHVSFMTNLPWDHIKGFVKKENDEKKVIEEIEIPSATELNDIAKINFKLTEGGIRDIKYVEEEGERVFYLPEITLNSDSEIILRNLVAYEAAAAAADGQNASLELSEYVELMCGIVDTSKDVDLLMKSGIIQGNSNVEEIADIFNGISITIGKSKKKKSELEMAIETVNEKYGNIFRVKAYKIMKKYIYESWKFLAVIFTLVLIVLLSLQAFCQVYGCSNRWFHTSN